jgi:TetR/AcrR family transcriptional regulator
MGSETLNAEAPAGRRERNKQEKLERITSVARELFAQKGISEVTTQEVAQRADIAAGTLFLYAKTKGELLLLSQNASYSEAHRTGVDAAGKLSEPVAAILAVMKPIIVCNREHVENGRTYLLEVVFGTANDGYRKEALELMAGTEMVVGDIASRVKNIQDSDGRVLAKAAMAIMFLTLSSPLNLDLTVDEILAEIESQLKLLF